MSNEIPEPNMDDFVKSIQLAPYSIICQQVAINMYSELLTLYEELKNKTILLEVTGKVEVGRVHGTVFVGGYDLSDFMQDLESEGKTVRITVEGVKNVCDK